jgi:hypothetical protein
MKERAPTHYTSYFINREQKVQDLQEVGKHATKHDQLENTRQNMKIKTRQTTTTHYEDNPTPTLIMVLHT